LRSTSFPRLKMKLAGRSRSSRSGVEGLLCRLYLLGFPWRDTDLSIKAAPGIPLQYHSEECRYGCHGLARFDQSGLVWYVTVECADIY
jgi:hypothetical protein